jgi:hypothetical protein
MLFAGTEGWASITRGNRTMPATGAISLRKSNERPGYSIALMALLMPAQSIV